MIEGQCTGCGAAAQQPIGGTAWSHADGTVRCAGASFGAAPPRKSWPPAVETKVPGRIEVK